MKKLKKAIESLNLNSEQAKEYGKLLNNYWTHTYWLLILIIWFFSINVMDSTIYFPILLNEILLIIITVRTIIFVNKIINKKLLNNNFPIIIIEALTFLPILVLVPLINLVGEIFEFAKYTGYINIIILVIGIALFNNIVIPKIIMKKIK